MMPETNNAVLQDMTSAKKRRDNDIRFCNLRRSSWLNLVKLIVDDIHYRKQGQFLKASLACGIRV